MNFSKVGPFQVTRPPERADPAELRFYVVEDHPVIRAFLVRHLEKEFAFTLCGWSADSRQALAEIPKLKPDLLILDLSLSEGHGLGLVHELLAEVSDLRILVFSGHEEQLYAARVLEAGALGYLCKSATPEQITAAVRKVMKREVYLSLEMTNRTLINRVVGERISPTRARSGLAALSDRELQVFELIGQGHETKQIAEQLNLDLKTVETYRARIKIKLGHLSFPVLMRSAFHFVQRGCASGAGTLPI